MADYKHGAYGQIQAVGTRVAATSSGVIVYVGTAPVNQIEGGADNVNVPILVNNIAEARKALGYSDNWADFTLCEAMHVHLEEKGVGPVVFINVLDPKVHKDASQTTKTLTPNNGRVIIADAELVYMDSVTVTAGSGEEAVTKRKGVDYSIAYNIDKKQIVIAELTPGALGTSALTIKYDTVAPSSVTEDTIIGTTDDIGSNTGIYAIKNVYQVTGQIPAYLSVPGFSSLPLVHKCMLENSVKINGHWDAYLFVDLPIVADGIYLTLATAKAWKDANGYNKENETVFFPLAQGVDGKIYHISVLAAANFQELLLSQNGIPYKTASNTPASLIQNLYLGAANVGRIFDDEIINKYLNKNGIASAAYVGGRWAIWGAHSADYDQTNGDSINVAETNRMMLYYISNDFQHRRTFNVDQPMTANDLKFIVSEEQTRLDALISMGALISGKVELNAEYMNRSDIMMGDFAFLFDVTTTPLAKSLTAVVNWTDEGFTTYFESFTE